MKGEIQADHMPLNKHRFAVVGFIEFTAMTVSGIEEELNTVQLPDRTMVSGGEKDPFEFDVAIPLHHTAEVAAMELWFVEAQALAPTYKKPVTYTFNSGSGNNSKNYTLAGVFPKKMALPESDKENDGEMALLTVTFSSDELIPI